MTSNIIKGKEATEGILRGVKEAVDLIRPTYGGAGTNGIVESKLRPGHGIYNDAWSLLKDVKFEEPAERRGLGFVKELCERTDKLTGDNRKTTLILLDEILTAGYEADINKLQLKRELDELIPFIESEIDKQTRPVTVDEIASVATTASESEEIGKLLHEIYQHIGKDGIIHLEGSGTYETTVKYIDGVRFDMTGFLSPYMVHDEQAKKDKVKETMAVYENPTILVTKKKITTDDDINPLLWEMKREGKKDLIIFTNDMDSGVAAMLIGLHRKGEFNILIIKAPVLWQNSVFEDFAKCTGATIVEDATGLDLRKLPFEALGTCGKITVDEDETTIFGAADISDHIANLQAKGDEESKLRLSWLVTKSAILKLGSNSETDLSYKRLKCADAIRSSQLALKYGIVAGGGVTLLNVSKTLPDTIAGSIMKVATMAPIKQITDNYGGSEELYWHNSHDLSKTTYGFNPDTEQHKIKSYGFDAKKGIYTDMFEAGIIDSSQTVKSAVRNAIGIASTILTASSLVYIPKLSFEEMQYQIAMNKNYDFNQN